MQYNFDEIIERKNTNSLKYDFAKERRKPADVLPLWVADMDFRAPQPVLDALIEKCNHGIFGYSVPKEAYFTILEKWYKDHFSWHIKEEWLVNTPGVVYAVSTAIRALTKKGEAVLIQKPVYYPFSSSVLGNERRLVNNSLVYKNGRYEMDFVDFEKKIVDENVKMFILCNPHNPVGRVWSKEELIKIGDICVKNHVIVVSDEIHADFIWSGHKHIVFADIKPEFADITVTCTAPSKTFNMAGLQISNNFIGNKSIRKEFEKEISRSGYDEMNIMAIIACQAAYQYGGEWLDQLKTYIEANISFTDKYLKENLPTIKLVKPEGTYLLWLDCSALGLSDQELDHFILTKSKLWLDDGIMFGKEGSGFQRINAACPRETLEKALHNLKHSVIELSH